MTKLSKRAASLATGAVALAAPTVAMAAGGGEGEGHILTTAIFHAINLIALVGIAIYFARKPFQGFLADRKKQITADLEEARRLREEARALLEKYDAQLAGLEAEKESVLAEYREVGEAERDRIITAARKQADKIAADAEKTIETELARARTALEAEVVRLATELAEEALRKQLDARAQDKLVDNYLGDLERELQA